MLGIVSYAVCAHPGQAAIFGNNLFYSGTLVSGEIHFVFKGFRNNPQWYANCTLDHLLAGKTAKKVDRHF